MKPIRQALSVCRHSRKIFFVVLLTFVICAALGAVEPADRPAEEGVWITLGADAFESLVDLEATRYELEPLERVAEQSGVVLTRVRPAGLLRISAELHESHNRCAGFVAHASYGDGLKELERVAIEWPSRGPSGGYSIDQSALVQRLEAAIDKPEMLDVLDHLSNDFTNRYHSNPVGSMAPLWIRDLWLGYAAGRPDVTVELYFHSGTIQPSVILTIEGGELADEVVVLGAHLDSISFNGGNSGSRDYLAPGADDDASGIIVLSEVIRVAMAKNFRPKRTVQFMGYAAEEVGLIGSDEIAAAYQAAGINVVAVQQLDMTAYFGSVEDIGVLSEQWTDPELTTFVTDLIDFYQPELQWVFTACGYGCSDHRSWDVRGYPAAMAFESRFGQHNPAIHTIDDTLATLGHSVDHAYKFARLAVAFMVEIAKESNLDIFADGFESGDTSAWSLVVP